MAQYRFSLPNSILITLNTNQQEKDAVEIEPDCLVKVDEFGFFMHWKSEPRVMDFFSFLILSYYLGMERLKYSRFVRNSTHLLEKVDGMRDV